jgi:hypothetical protein
MADASDGSRIGWPLRTWLFVEIGFGLAAMASIALSPADTATNFAWPIKPTVTAALLGAFYMSSAWVFVVAAFARRWEDIRVMMIPAILFTATELLATFLHWDRFTIGSAPFWIWFASYLLPPPILAACYVWQRRRERPLADRLPFPGWLRLLMLVVGAVLVVDAVVTFIWPETLTSRAPWQFSALTARALCGWMIALGSMLVFAALENDRKRTRVLSPFFILLPPAAILQLNRFSGEVDWSHWSIYVNGLVLLFVAATGLYIAAAGWRDFFGRRRA